MRHILLAAILSYDRVKAMTQITTKVFLGNLRDAENAQLLTEKRK
jgi:hypothetical protein